MRRSALAIVTATTLGLGVLAGTAHADSHQSANNTNTNTNTSTSTSTDIHAQNGAVTFAAQVAKVDAKTGKQAGAHTVLCEWTGNSKWTAGDPTEVTATAGFYCAAVGPDGPMITGEIRARLLDGKNNSAVAEGKWSFINAIDPTPTTNEVTKKVKRTRSLYVQNEMHGAFMTPGWVWTQLPKGCSGAATPNVVCKVNYAKFTV
ncbi:hypothetical protein [Streptomyces sp. NBC_00212]|uniref:hypothetical protein n=1 Tax=Streptomyces sp. NBC_00212 TaxID=2975684 RepID=UPI0032477821